MRREPPITFRGALQLLGHYGRPLVDRLDKLLGGAILAAGALVTVPALAALAPLFGWVDQKNEAAGLLRTCLDKLQSRLSGVQGYDRIELLAAAHTMIAVDAFFEVMHEEYPSLELSAAERERLATGRWRKPDDDLLTVLWANEVPAPSGARGFYETSVLVQFWATQLCLRVLTFADDSEATSRATSRAAESVAVADMIVRRYRESYLRLADTVPDFWIWAQLDEHAATRVTVATALSRIETLLGGLTAGSPTPGRQRAALARANRDVLDRPVVGWPGSGDHPGAITFPAVGESYVNPRYRMATAGGFAEDHAIFVIGGDGPVPMGSVTGSLSEGRTRDLDGSAPEVLE
ncbi:NACHT N-terminal helical domain 7-containing protein [Paractinoplanes globisporus]|uniref:NACHT N-terminal Helical domain-containing protein n=1 Tax=Paractinoplanes globisporus TaxID=113565 RepID=A0ABW6W991_9ACTN|nr:hypothetical protein [Actinoplanes globisporus]